MAIEKRWVAIPPRAFASPGTSRGVVTLSSTAAFKVKMVVGVLHPTLPQLELEVKRVISKTQLVVGPIRTGLQTHADLTGYDTQSSIFSQEQDRPAIPLQEASRATFEEEPTVATRVLNVDQWGRPLAPDNPMPVVLTDGSINIGTLNQQIQVSLSHQSEGNDPPDSVRIGDGTDEWDILPTGEGRVADEQARLTLEEIQALLQSLITYVDGLESLLSTVAENTSGNDQTLINIQENTDQLESLLLTTNELLTTIGTYTDGLEGLLASLAAKLDAILQILPGLATAAKQDEQTALLDAIRILLLDLKSLNTNLGSKLDTIHADNLITHAKQDITNSTLESIDNKVATESTLQVVRDRLDTMIGHVDQVEGLLGTINANTDQLESYLDQVEGFLSQIVSNTNALKTYTDEIESLLTQIRDKITAGDVPHGPGINRIISLTQTAVEAKVNATPLATRKYVEMQALSPNVKWGYDSTCPFDLFHKQFMALPAGPTCSIFVKSSNNGPVQVVVAEK